MEHSAMISLPDMIMIGGNSRNSGKTSVACGIIHKLSVTRQVIGLKLTRIRPGENKWHGSHSEEELVSGFTISEELDTQSDKDTSKMLRAGATRVFYIRTGDPNAEPAIKEFLRKYIQQGFIVCESRSLRNIIKPGLFIMMMRVPGIGDKKAVQMYINEADCTFNYADQPDEIKLFIDSLYFKEGKFEFVTTLFDTLI